MPKVQGMPKVNPGVDAFGVGGAQASIQGWYEQAFAANAQANAAASGANTASVQVAQLDMQSRIMNSELNDMLGHVTYYADTSAQIEKDAVKEVKATEAVLKTSVDAAATMAAQEVGRMFASKYDELQDWRDTTLTDRNARGVKAGAKAAEPYNRMVQEYRNRMQVYQAEALATSSKANRLEADAVALAKGAQDRMASGDEIGAKQDRLMATSMRAESQGLINRAHSLQKTAVDMNKMIPQYLAAAHAAVWRAQYETNPEGLPPLPVDPNYAYTPPPP